MIKMFAINIYDETDEINIIDTGVVELDEEEVDSAIDLALEIAMRHKEGMNYENFVERLAEILKNNI